jgi:hypothetical protein
MTISTRTAAEIRDGIRVAREKIAGARRGPAIRFEDPSLFARAYFRELSNAVRDGRIRPPRGGSGISSPR